MCAGLLPEGECWMKFITGIDGGGTKTTVILKSLDDGTLYKKVFGPFNLNSIGEDAFRAHLVSIMDYLDGLGECQSLCIGAAGVSNVAMRTLVGEVMDAHHMVHWSLVGDSHIAMYGALDGKPGICVIAGTGSICFGLDAHGGAARVGGWGHLIGDEGSGYHLGLDAVKAVSRAFDGYEGASTQLLQLLADRKGLVTQGDIISFVYSHDKSAIASLSPLVEEAYRSGDAIASSIISKNAEDLSDAVILLAHKLGLEGGMVALLGGMLEHETVFRQVFSSLMMKKHPELICSAPLHDAATGALMLAASALHG